jgi:hypothetical protein
MMTRDMNTVLALATSKNPPASDSLSASSSRATVGICLVTEVLNSKLGRNDCLPKFHLALPTVKHGNRMVYTLLSVERTYLCRGILDFCALPPVAICFLLGE